MSKIIGITGSIGSGKSTVGNILESLAVPVIDTDMVVHKILAESKPAQEQILAAFGKEILNDTTNAIDRAKLGALVFSNENKRKQLEAIVHPLVLEECTRQIATLSQAPQIAVLVPLLFEAGLEDRYDEVWVVVTKESDIRSRLQKRDGLSNEEIDQRLAAQLPQKEKAARADAIIDNSGSREETKKRVQELLTSLV
jgi:dephospho-CoA kinase